MTDKKEFYLGMLFFFIVTLIIDIGVMVYSAHHYSMNEDDFVQVGMMEYVNPTDHRKLYIPIFIKR